MFFWSNWISKLTFDSNLLVVNDLTTLIEQSLDNLSINISIVNKTNFLNRSILDINSTNNFIKIINRINIKIIFHLLINNNQNKFYRQANNLFKSSTKTRQIRRIRTNRTIVNSMITWTLNKTTNKKISQTIVSITIKTIDEIDYRLILMKKKAKRRAIRLQCIICEEKIKKIVKLLRWRAWLL